jgi:chromosome segregation ATPase
MDKTVKISAYSPPTKGGAPQDKPAMDRFAALELEQKQAQLDEERNKSLELLRNLVQLRESLKQEQARSAEQEAKLNKLAALEESQIAKRNVQIEEEKKYSLELMRTIEQLKEQLKQEKSRVSEIADSGVQLKAKIQEITALKAKIKDLSGVFGKIVSIAEAAKVVTDK